MTLTGRHAAVEFGPHDWIYIGVLDIKTNQAWGIDIGISIGGAAVSATERCTNSKLKATAQRGATEVGQPALEVFK